MITGPGFVDDDLAFLLTRTNLLRSSRLERNPNKDGMEKG
jgi:hypothetical protein